VRKQNYFWAEGRRRKQLLYDRKETRIFWELKTEALGRTVWRTRFGGDYGPVLGHAAELMNVGIEFLSIVEMNILLQNVKYGFYYSVPERF
jgi:hypothetical protein